MSVLIIVALSVVFVGCERGGNLSRYTIEEVAFDTTYDVVTMTREISARYPNRTSGSEAEASQGGGDYDILASSDAGGYAQNDYIFLNEYVAPKMAVMGYLLHRHVRRLEVQVRIQRRLGKGGDRREQGRDLDCRGI